MADLNNLLGEIEDREEDGGGYVSPSPDDDLDGVPQPDDDDDVEGGIGSRPAGRRAAAATAELPPALAEAQRNKEAAAAAASSSRYVGVSPDDYGVDGDDDGGYGGADVDASPDQDDDAQPTNADPEYEQLKSIWSQELMCPEILPNDAETVALHVELLRGQEDTIEELQEQAARGGGGGGGGGSGGDADPMLASLAASIYRMEADRVRFLLADLTRTRLAKIENHALFNREMVDRMSEEEISYLQQYGGLLERHYQRTVLNHLPKEAWRKLDEPEMIDEPDLDAYVFCRVLETVEIDNNAGQKKVGEEEEEEDDEFGGSVQEHGAGSCLIARYFTVRDLVLQGKVVLLM